MHRYRLRPKVLQNRLRRIKITLTTICIVSVITAVIVGGSWVWKDVSSNQEFLITSVRLPNNLQHIPNTQLKKIVQQYVHGNFFSYNATSLSQALYQLPWVDKISIRKIWPHTLAISIKERQAVARWQGNQMLDQNGNLFSPSKEYFPGNLPLLNGPTGEQHLLWQQCQYFNQILAPLHLWINTIDLTRRQSWRIQLNNGLWVFLGTQNWKQNLINFVRYYSHIIENKVNKSSYVDMRYPNGFVIGNK